MTNGPAFELEHLVPRSTHFVGRGFFRLPLYV
jgi:hypothetical protein